MENLEVLEGQLDIFGVAAKSDGELIELLTDITDLNDKFIQGARFTVDKKHKPDDKIRYWVQLDGRYYGIFREKCKEVF